MEFFHKSCGNRIVVDITASIQALAPSLSLGDNHASVAMIEIRAADNKVAPRFFCSHCKSHVNDASNIVSTCSLCGKNHPVSELYMNDFFNAVCSTCKRSLEEGNNTSSVVRRVAEYYSVKEVLKVFRKPVSEVLASFKI